MHSFRVGNVSLDVAERAPHCQRKRRRGNEHYRASIVPRALVHAFTRADVAARPARKYTRAYTHTHTHTHTLHTRATHIGAEGPTTALSEILPTGQPRSPRIEREPGWEGAGCGANLMRDHLALTVCFSMGSSLGENTLPRSTERGRSRLWPCIAGPIPITSAISA